jgi:hypothetical protein
MSEIVVVITGATGPSGGGGGGGASTLDDLTDVTITAAAAGDILRHNGTAWVDAVGTTHFEAAGGIATHAAVTSSVHGISAFGATLVDDADAATARTTLGLGALATLAGIRVEDEGTSTVASAVALNFVGAGVAVTDAGSGEATVTISGGGGGSVATDAIFDAKGDLPVGTGADTAAKLTVGTDGHQLAALASASTGLHWRMPPVRVMTDNATRNYATFMPVNYTGGASNQGNRLTIQPIYIDRPCTLASLNVEVTTLESGSVCRLGLYAISGWTNTTVTSTSLIVDGGTVSGTTTGVKTVSPATSIVTPGWYALAAAVGNYGTVRIIPPYNTFRIWSPYGFDTGSSNMLTCWTVTTDYSGGLPASIPTLTQPADSAVGVQVWAVFS